MHTKTAVSNALLLTWYTASPHSRCQFKASLSWKGDLPNPEESFSICLPMQAIALQTRWWRRLSWKKAMVASDAASSFILFILFHSARSPELLEWYCQVHVSEILAWKIFVAHPLLRNFFNTKDYNMKICKTNISDLQYFNSLNQTSSTVSIWP